MLLEQKHAFAVDDGKKIKENKKDKGTKKCVIKNELMLQDYKNSLFKDKIIRKSQLRFKSDCHTVYTEKINKTALSSNVIKEFKHLIKSARSLMERMFLKYVKMK